MYTVPSLIVRYSCCVPPALRDVRTASSKCLPVEQASISVGDALSISCVTLISLRFALPVPPPPPSPIVPVLDTPKDHEWSSISSLCAASFDSPLTSPSFKKISVAIAYTPLVCELAGLGG